MDRSLSSGLSTGADRRAAFTLAECLVALMVISVILSLFFSPFKGALYVCRAFVDRRVAESRIWTACGILRGPIFYCALGIPGDAGEYKKSFGSQLGAPFSWDGPVSVTSDKNGRSNGCLRLAYAYPELCRTRQEGGVGKVAAGIRFDTAPNRDHFDLDLYDKSKSVKNWVLFENCRPRRSLLLVTKASGSELELKNYGEEEAVVSKGERLLLFRAMECWAWDDKLYTKDFRTTGDQPRENGICDIRFYLDDGKNLLTVYLVARGGDETLAPGGIVGEENCREEILAQWRGRSRHILYCAKFSWPLPNVRGP
ncbi:prepilin-type N-terminal cleavage/methylation domain-containing protein [Cloacibacillus evryensis]|uniref:Prepilin-type N-terminal cleavage/methylation domain-containing protein n=1 Tax=Cloacibacillus evryensis TaxID=508460 RepID=A0AAW5K0F5_9BACT|nr:prepilin-type N-terminal cleavage/methylation domain-containing protein [Cloacibacillus evryensis]MCQ4813452.1 prepilin-type N-terminal cleavage/methylation domain-containing protein [Cloacibacillus evryensis]